MPAEAPASAQTTSGVPVLRLVRPAAAAALAATLAGRAIGPASAGMGVGMDHTIRALQRGGAIASQVFAIIGTVVAVVCIAALLRAKVSMAARVGALVLGGAVLLVGLAAPRERLPDSLSVILAVSAGVLALVSAWEAARAPFARAVALVVGLMGLSALVRVASVFLAYRAIEQGSVKLARATGLVATASFSIEVLGLAVAAAWLSARGKRITSPATIVALVVAFAITRWALRADGDDVGAATWLVRRSVDGLLTRPEPLISLQIRAFVAVLAPLLAGAVLVARGRVPALSGSLACALLVRGSADMPLGALVMVLAALAVVLASHDDRGLWASLAKAGKEGEIDPYEDRERSDPPVADAAGGRGPSGEGSQTDEAPARSARNPAGGAVEGRDPATESRPDRS